MKYTDEQIKEFAADRFPGHKSVNNLARQNGFIDGFKKAQELLLVQGTKPLSEVTELELSELAEIVGVNIGTHILDNYRSLSEFKKSILNTTDSSYRFMKATDYLRSKGYILPTQKA